MGVAVNRPARGDAYLNPRGEAFKLLRSGRAEYCPD